MDVILNAKSKNAEMLKQEVQMDKEYERMRQNDQVDTPPELVSEDASPVNVCVTESGESNHGEIADNMA